MNIKKLDLHGVRHADAKQQVISFVEANWDSEDEFEVITGHSTRMKEVVLTVLREYNLPYAIGNSFDAYAPKIIFWY